MTERKPAMPPIQRKFIIINPLDGAPGVPGFYRAQLEKGAAFVPVALRHQPPRDPDTGEFLDRSYLWSLEIMGELVAEPSICPQRAFGSYAKRPWGFSGEPITEEDYILMLEDRGWMKKNAPWSPEANPHKRADHDALPPIF